MADDFDVEAMLEAPYKKVGGRPEVDECFFFFKAFKDQFNKNKSQFIHLYDFPTRMDIVLMMSTKGEILKNAD